MSLQTLFPKLFPSKAKVKALERLRVCRKLKIMVTLLFLFIPRLDFVDRDEIGPDSIGVHMIAAPINPADINMIQGVLLYTDCNYNVGK